MKEVSQKDHKDNKKKAAQADPNTDRKKKKKAGRRNVLQVVLILLIFLAGVGLILYPWFSDRWNQLHQSRAIMQYSRQVDSIDTEAYDAIIQAAAEYNDRLAYRALNEGYQIEGVNDGLSGDDGSTEESTEGESVREGHEEYESLLNYDGTGMMGYISIPCIDVELPIYHGTSDAVLQTSIGHLEGSSLPVGGTSSHCVLSGHRGLPSARLFTDLDQVQIGNIFTFTILNETLTYQVDSIEVVEPYDLSRLQIEEGKDYVTLVTCTPYGINTHRLLVRGVRVPNGTEDLVSSDQSSNHGEDSLEESAEAATESGAAAENTVSQEELNANRLRDLGPQIAVGAVTFFLVVAIVSLIGRLVRRHGERKKERKEQRSGGNTGQEAEDDGDGNKPDPADTEKAPDTYGGEEAEEEDDGIYISDSPSDGNEDDDEDDWWT